MDVTIKTTGRIKRHLLYYVQPLTPKAKKYAKQYFRTDSGVHAEPWQIGKSGFLFDITSMDGLVNSMRYYGLEVAIDPEE
ncbi:MAG: hypothetical protein WA532_11445 [Candidatus Korobacteraceae bacterium]